MTWLSYFHGKQGNKEKLNRRVGSCSLSLLPPPLVVAPPFFHLRALPSLPRSLLSLSLPPSFRRHPTSPTRRNEINADEWSPSFPLTFASIIGAAGGGSSFGDGRATTQLVRLTHPANGSIPSRSRSPSLASPPSFLSLPPSVRPDNRPEGGKNYGLRSQGIALLRHRCARHLPHQHLHHGR